MRHIRLIPRLNSVMHLSILASLLISCGVTESGGRPASNDGDRSSLAPKRLVAAIMVGPPALHRPLIPGAYIIQAGDLADTVVHAGLSALDSQNVRRPLLAEAVPSLENGLWRTLPSGQMEQLWRIRPDAEWHDGTRLSAEDLVFTVKVGQDPLLSEFRAGVAGGYEMVEHVEAVDAQTVSVLWKQPFIKADRIFSSGLEGFAQAIPKHLLERAYAEGRETLLQMPYWSREYVGLGPYKLREWVAGSHLSLEANPRYVLGRPKIDQIEVRFILDANTISASLLAGAVDITLGIGLNLEQSLELRDQWREGRLAVAPVSYWLTVYPQFVNTSPPVIADVRFRRALIQALDRQAMVETIMAGLVPVAHSFIKPGDPEDRETEGVVVRYEYDVRRAAQGIEELGYFRGGDGAFRDQAGQRLGFEVRTNSNPAIHTKALFPVADYWQRLGLAAEPFLIPVQLTTDREYSAQFPGFYLLRQPIGPDNVDRFHSSEARLPENRFQGRNTARYMNSELDGLIERYTATIPLAPRMQLLSQIVHHVSDQLNAMGLFYDVGTTLVGNRVLNVPASNPTSNVHEWDLKD